MRVAHNNFEHIRVVLLEHGCRMGGIIWGEEQQIFLGRGNSKTLCIKWGNDFLPTKMFHMLKYFIWV